MTPTTEQIRQYLDVMEAEMRRALQEIVDSNRTVVQDDLIGLITAGVAERMLGQCCPPLRDIRRDVEKFFDPEFFTDGLGPGPLQALAAVRKRICG